MNGIDISVSCISTAVLMHDKSTAQPC